MLQFLAGFKVPFDEAECRKAIQIVANHPDQEAKNQVEQFYCDPQNPDMRGKSFDQRFGEYLGDNIIAMPTLTRAFSHAGINLNSE